MRLLIALIVWAAALAGAIALSSSVARTVHNEQAKAAAAGAVHSRSAPAFDPASIKPADPRSLFVGSNFGRALALVRRHVGSRAAVEMLEAFPGELNVTVLKGATELSVLARVNGQYLSSSDSAAPGSSEMFRLSQIHPDVPAALARRIDAQGRVPVAKLNFIQVRIDPIEHRFHWFVYPKRDNLYFQADTAHGPIQEFSHGRPILLIRG